MDRHFDLILGLIRINHGFQDHRAIVGNQLGDSLESASGGEADGYMFPLWINFAHMDLPKPSAESSQHSNRDSHRRIDLPGVTDVEAEACIRELLKNAFHFWNRPPDRLSLIHILQAEPWTEESPVGWALYQVRVHDDGPGRGDVFQDRYQAKLFQSSQLARSVQRHVGKALKIELRQGFHQREELISSQSGKLDRR